MMFACRKGKATFRSLNAFSEQTIEKKPSATDHTRRKKGSHIKVAPLFHTSPTFTVTAPRETGLLSSLELG